MRIARLVCLTAMLSTAGVTLAQTGSITPTHAQLSGLKTYSPPAIEFIEEPIVDLRRWMPAVGEQLLNDCTAWAVAYGAKSYAEARDQGWRPDRPDRIFSPSFVYNQINGGKDEGSNFIKALQLIQSEGAATLATAPYSPRNYTAPPNPRAVQEASAFRIHDASLIWDRNGIRRALQRKQVVIFGAHVNPDFLGGTFTLYNRKAFEADEKKRRPNQPHGKHAMVIVGYDDTKQAFLIQNSWGTRWNNRGLAWVAYELFDDIRVTDDSDGVFCNWAVTMLDIEEPIERGPDGLPRPKPLDLSTLRASGFSDLIRFDTASGKFLYSFVVELRGQPQAMEQIARVTWRWTTADGQPREVVTSNMAGRFGVQSSTVHNPLPVIGQIEFKDGTEQKVEATIQGPVPKADFREASIVFDHAFHSMTKDTNPRPLYQWEVGLDFPLNERDDIVKVVWNLGRMHGDEPTRVLDDHWAGHPAEVRPFHWATDANPISVDITYADGGVKRLQYAPKFDAEVIRGFDIEAEFRELAKDHRGQTHYAWTLRLKRAREWDTRIKAVDYKVDPVAGDAATTLRGLQSFEGWPVHGSSHRDFRVHAVIHFEDGRTQKLEKWIELGRDARYPDANRVDLVAHDVYHGFTQNGEPKWDTIFRVVGDWEQVQQIEQVTIHRPEEYGGEDEVYTKDRILREFDFRVVQELYRDHRPLEIGATVRLQGGRESKLRLRHEPQSRGNEALAIAVEMDETAQTYLDPNHLNTYRYVAKVTGPQTKLRHIARIDWHYQVRGKHERSVIDRNLLGNMDAFRLISALTEPFILRARVEFDDGFEEWLTARLEPGVSIREQPDLKIEVREKFWQYQAPDNRPLWLSSIQVVGDVHLLGRIKSIQYASRAIDSLAEPTARAVDTNQVWRSARSGPMQVSALVTFDDGQTRSLDSVIHAATPRPAQPLELRLTRVYAPELRTNAWQVRVDGWEATRDRVRKVVFTADDHTQTITAAEGISPRIFHTIVPGPNDPNSNTPKLAKAVVTLDDGSEHQLEAPIHALPMLDWAWEQTAYWGEGQWVIEARLVGPQDRLDMMPIRIWFPFEERKHRFDPVPTWPDNQHRVILAPGEYRTERPQYSLGLDRVGYLEARTITVRDKPELRQETLELIVEPVDHLAPGPVAPRWREWRVRLRGPESQLSSVSWVLYETSIQGQSRDVSIHRRWGEFYDGFEHRYYSETQPSITAHAVIAGQTVVLKSQPAGGDAE